MSAPCPPAFMRTAPPIEPGTPTAHSNPVNPQDTVRRATTGSDAAAPAVTSEPSWVISANASPRVKATPSKPRSATRRFEPRPTARVATPVARTAAASAARSSSSSTRTNRAAGPPTR